MYYDSKPLLPHGMHEKTIDELSKLCVLDFDDNSKRKYLFDNLMNKVIEPLKNLGIECELWIDGSFLTEKNEPNDIDLAIGVKSFNLNQNQLAFLNSFSHSDFHNRLKNEFSLDVYFVTNESYRYWFDLFSSDRSNTPKGFVLLNLEGGM